MHEIITLQLGQQSNYLATHFWNTQESYFTYDENEESPVNHDIHWRPGLGADGSETYMPRTVIYDLKGGFGSLKKINALYDAADDNAAAASSLWSGPTVVQKADPIAPSTFQQSLDAGLAPPALTPATVRYWSDFNRVYYHPRSIVQINDYELHSSLQPFERWDAGEELFAALDKEHDLLDRDLRPFVEEADALQAVQLFATLDDAWGGFAARYVERLRDELGKTPACVWAAHQQQGAGAAPVPRDKRLLRLVNTATSLTELYKQASLVVPLALPAARPSLLRLDPSSAWHTAALLSAAVESATLPSRLKGSAAASWDSLGNMADSLHMHGKQTIASLQMSVAGADAVPRSANAGDEARDGLRLDLDFGAADEADDVAGRRAQQGGARATAAPKIFSQVVASRGARAYDDQDDAAAAAEGHDEDDRMRRRGRGETVTRRYRSTLTYPLPDSFPASIFRDAHGAPLTSSNGGGAGLAVTTALTTDAALSGRLRALRATVTRFGLVGREDREALGNELAQMAEEYHEGWSSGSDFGDDED